MSARIWHKGPPPHVGWWNASVSRHKLMWRWWDGEFWSVAVGSRASSESAAKATKIKGFTGPNGVEWTDYYPESARVPRIDPRTTK